MSTVRRTVELDEEFRGRVARAADGQAAVGQQMTRGAWLWLMRTEGWELELAEIAARGAERAAEVEERKLDSEARRRSRVLESAFRKISDDLDAALMALSGATADLERERKANSEFLSAKATLEARIELAERDKREAIDAARKSAAAAAEANQTIEATRQARALVDSELSVLRRRARHLEERLASQEATLERQSVELKERSSASPEKYLAAAISDAARSAAQLGESLGRAAAALGPRSGDSDEPGWPESVDQPDVPADGRGFDDVGDRVGDPSDRPWDGASGEAFAALPPQPLPPRPPPEPLPPQPLRPRLLRRPVSLPLAVFEESAEAADHLLRVPGALLLVDGYNVSMTAWPDLRLVDQRDRLTWALNELNARVTIDVHVVFDGASQAGTGTPVMPRRAVRVTFSPAEVDADEVIIELSSQLPPNRPILVATSDRRVQAEVRRLGANVVSSTQLLAALGRSRRP